MDYSPTITRPWTRWCALSIITLGLLIASHTTSASTSPSRSEYVVDTETFLSNFRLKKMNRLLSKHYAQHQDEVIVGILDSLNGTSAQEKLDLLMEKWHVGTQEGRGMLILLITEEKEVYTQSGPKLAYRVPEDAVDTFRSIIIDTQFEPKRLGRKLNRALGKLLESIKPYDPLDEAVATLMQASPANQERSAPSREDAPQTKPSPQAVPSGQHAAVPLPSFDESSKSSTRADEDRADEAVAEETPPASRSLRERLEDWLEKFSMFLFFGAFLVEPVLMVILVLQMIVKELFDLDEEHSVMRFFELLQRTVFDYLYAFVAFIIGVIATKIFGDSIGGWIVGLGFYLFTPRISLDDSSSSDDGDSWSSSSGSSSDFGGGGGSFGGGGASGSW